MNLLEQQASNRRRTWLVMLLFVLFFALLGYGFDSFYLGTRGVPLPIATTVALAVGSVSAVTSYFGGDRAVLRLSGAVPIEATRASAGEEARLKLRQLENIVEEMSIASGLPRPRLFVVPDADPNAFATGRDPEHASVAVTQGLLDRLNREQLQAVVAHELSHVRNYDIRLMTIVAALVGAIALLADWAARGLWFGGGGSRRRDRDSGGGAAGVVFFAVWIVAVILAPFVAQMLAMAVSRRREYLADASAAELTRNPRALADALESIEGEVGPTRAMKRGIAHLCITDPLGRRMDLRRGFWADLFASHPPMPDRIRALRTMAYQSDS